MLLITAPPPQTHTLPSVHSEFKIQPARGYAWYPNHFIMAVWILAGNGINLSIAAVLIRRHIPGVCNEGEPCQHTLNANHWRRLRKFQQLLVSKTTLQPSIMFTNPFWICFIVEEFFLMDLNMLSLKVWGVLWRRALWGDNFRRR